MILACPTFTLPSGLGLGWYGTSLAMKVCIK